MDENRKLIHTYEILKKDFSKAIPRWKVPEEILFNDGEKWIKFVRETKK